MNLPLVEFYFAVGLCISIGYLSWYSLDHKERLGNAFGLFLFWGVYFGARFLVGCFELGGKLPFLVQSAREKKVKRLREKAYRARIYERNL